MQSKNFLSLLVCSTLQTEKTQVCNHLLGAGCSVFLSSQNVRLVLFDHYLKLLKKSSVTIYLFSHFKGSNNVLDVIFWNLLKIRRY